MRFLYREEPSSKSPIQSTPCGVMCGNVSCRSSLTTSPTLLAGLHEKCGVAGIYPTLIYPAQKWLGVETDTGTTHLVWGQGVLHFKHPPMPCKPLKSAAQALIAPASLLGVLTAKRFACRVLCVCRVTRRTPCYDQEVSFEIRFDVGLSYSVGICL